MWYISEILLQISMVLLIFRHSLGTSLLCSYSPPTRPVWEVNVQRSLITYGKAKIIKRRFWHGVAPNASARVFAFGEK